MDKLYVKLDSQILNSMSLCPERYRLEMTEHWRPISKAKALERGSAMHTMIAHYRRCKKAGFAREDHHRVVAASILKGRVAITGMENISVQMFEEEDIPVFYDYILKWQYDGWDIIDVEQPFSKVLYEDETLRTVMDVEYNGLVIIYEGIIDARIRDPKQGVFVVDTKTESRRSWPYVLSNQFQGYEWAFGVPVLIDKVGYQTSLKPEEKFRRLLHDSGVHGVREWREDCISYVNQALGWHELMHKGIRLPKNRTSCDKYSGCTYQKVCQVPEESRAFKLQANFIKDEKWDPYTRDEDSGMVDED